MRHLILLLACAANCIFAVDGYHEVEPRALQVGEIAVTGPGIYATAGKTYVLTRDISAAGSAIFLGKNVVLDLNGHTVTYAAAGYQMVPNGSFEDGLTGWNLSLAPHARAEDRRWLNPMVGNKACVLPSGEEIISPYITLPVANRAYYAQVAVAAQTMVVDVRVEDAVGNPVTCVLNTPFGARQTCPELNRSPKLGGGVVFALLFNRPAGSYRIRVKAIGGECIIDDVDIRPALDVGIGVVGDVMPWAYYKSVLDGDDTAFFEWSSLVDPVRAASAPLVTGSGTVTVRNGTIRCGSPGIRTWGLQSTAAGVSLAINNVRVISSGINANAMRFASGSLTNSRTELDSPWIIDRHRQADYGVNLTGGAVGSLITHNEFIGGQGQLSIQGANAEVAYNLFVNKQKVVNHYSLGAGQASRIHHNRFLPEQGSGILVGGRDSEIYANDFVITASPPVNEYARDIYSVSAIRLTDYNQTSGPDVCVGNRIHDNRFEITGRRFPSADAQYRPTAHGIYMSVGGGQNFVYDNEFTIRHLAPPNNCSRGEGAFAFFIGGSDNGGTYYRNRITSNVIPVWIANTYGRAGNVTLYGNDFTCTADSGQPAFSPIWLGWWNNRPANVGFYSNRFSGLPFGVAINDDPGFISGYTFGWTLTVRAAPGAAITVVRNGGTTVATGTADAQGQWVTRLAEFEEHGTGGNPLSRLRTPLAGYQVTAGAATQAVQMDRDRLLTFAGAPLNHAPVAHGQGLNTSLDTAKEIVLTGTDPDGNALTFAIVAQPAHGTLSGAGAIRVYSPDPGWSGDDSFTFRVNDGITDSNLATVSVSVISTNGSTSGTSGGGAGGGGSCGVGTAILLAGLCFGALRNRRRQTSR